MRVLRQPPAFVATAVITLATGIGSVVTMFSVYSQVVLNPVRLDHPETLVSLYSVNPTVNIEPPTLSWQRFDLIRRVSKTLASVAAYTSDSVAFSVPGSLPEQLRALRVSGDFFAAIGVHPIAGRVFRPEDDIPNGPSICILSYEVWQSRFGGEPLIGKSMMLDAKPHEIIGILPSRMTPPWGDQQIFLPR